MIDLVTTHSYLPDPDGQSAMVREGFWPKFRRLVRRLPFAEDLLAAYYAAVLAAALRSLASHILPAHRRQAREALWDAMQEGDAATASNTPTSGGIHDEDLNRTAVGTAGAGRRRRGAR
jgi:hypothetical protein